MPTVITTPNTMNNLLTDRGWERLGRLLAGDPNFCSVVPIGEFSNVEETPAKAGRGMGRGRAPRSPRIER
jgi:hypothetical protein